MKTIVLAGDIHEFEIKPQALLDEYRQLLAKDVQDFFVTNQRLVIVNCPGCLSENSRLAFKKFNLEYRECDRCKSIFVSPRPSESDLIDFYRNSPTAIFWREQIFPKTSTARRDKIFRPQVRWLLDVIDHYRPASQNGIILGYHSELLVEELLDLEKELFDITVTTPTADIEFKGQQYPGVSIEPKPIKELSSLAPVDVFLAFDILDRCANPEELVVAVCNALSPGGLVLANTTLGSGFDLQILWDRSDSIYPPDRLNLLSVEGVMALVDRHGFEVIEFSTPGRFDVDIVQRAIENDPDGDWDRFVRYLVNNRDEHAMKEFQDYLQANRLSSFGRLVLRKPE